MYVILYQEYTSSVSRQRISNHQQKDGRTNVRDVVALVSEILVSLHRYIGDNP